jgi:hypothetical protein
MGHSNERQNTGIHLPRRYARHAEILLRELNRQTSAKEERRATEQKRVDWSRPFAGPGDFPFHTMNHRPARTRCSRRDALGGAACAALRVQVAGRPWTDKRGCSCGHKQCTGLSLLSIRPSLSDVQCKASWEGGRYTKSIRVYDTHQVQAAMGVPTCFLRKSRGAAVKTLQSVKISDGAKRPIGIEKWRGEHPISRARKIRILSTWKP